MEAKATGVIITTMKLNAFTVISIGLGYNQEEKDLPSLQMWTVHWQALGYEVERFQQDTAKSSQAIRWQKRY